VNEVPEEIQALVAQREAARRRRDYLRADALRERIREGGFDVTDAPEGPALSSRETAQPVDGSWVRRAQDVPSVLSVPAPFDASIQWVVQGWAEDVRRGIDSFRRYHPGARIQHVVVELTGSDPTSWPDGVEVVSMDPAAGWAEARNAAIRRAAGPLVLLVDGSIEARGEVLEPLGEALADPSAGLTGPFGLVTSDLREFRSSPGPAVDAVEGYLMAFRRDLVERGVRFDPKFRFYRMADVDLSFQVLELGLRVSVTEVPIERHEHRVWEHMPEEQRTRLSKRNFYRFLDRWRGRLDLTVAGRDRTADGREST
jgi:hypothetical protein